MEDKIINFFDTRYRKLFSVPDGSYIEITHFDGEKSRYQCQYIDDCYMRIGINVFTKLEFAKKMEKIGAVYAPEWTRPEDICGVYEIYQIRNPNNIEYSYAPFTMAKRKFNPLDYKRVYTSMISPKMELSEIYMTHNKNFRPFKDKINSMNKSDVIVLCRNESAEAYYVDSISNFIAVPQFFKPKTVIETEREKVGERTITVRIPVNDKVFVLGESRNSPQPFVTWQGYKNYKGYDWGHYYNQRTDAVRDLYRRVAKEIDDPPYSPDIWKNKDKMER